MSMTVQRFFALFICAALLFSIATGQRRSQQPKPKPAAKSATAQKPKSELEKMGPPPPVPTLKKQPEQEVSPGDVVSVDTTEVMFPVTVRDSQGRLINDLTRNDFRVYEDNRLQPR